MTRPGPRPYECVRRAWHSDRHQPIRGSIIQELFRVANEIHSSTTRKNKEWQQKLPFVVIKAEEIIYSKANSEAEYVDLKTLLERANDAIDTIIRKEDADESGDFLQPCIEAALNLGCVPRRASRSERHNSPRCYLSSVPQEIAEKPLNPQGGAAGALELNVRPQQQCPYQNANLHVDQPPRGCGYQFSPRYPLLGSPNCESAGVPPGTRSFNFERRDAQPTSCMGSVYSDLSRFSGVPSDARAELSMLGRVYPLYYPPSFRSFELPMHNQWNSGHNSGIFGGGDGSASDARDVERCHVYDFLGPKGALDGSSSSGNVARNAQDTEFDLSLRLAPPSECFSNGRRIWVCESEDVASNSSYSGSRL